MYGECVSEWEEMWVHELPGFSVLCTDLLACYSYSLTHATSNSSKRDSERNGDKRQWNLTAAYTTRSHLQKAQNLKYGERRSGGEKREKWQYCVVWLPLLTYGHCEWDWTPIFENVSLRKENVLLSIFLVRNEMEMWVYTGFCCGYRQKHIPISRVQLLTPSGLCICIFCVC